MACTSSCTTKDHASYGECLKDNAPRVAFANSAAGADYTEHRRWFKRLAEYRDAKRQGIQPKSAQLHHIREAVRVSDELGVAFRADQ